jgi:Protein of unknown function (DUF1003)
VAARQDHHGAFGQDAFGRRAERAARFFGTPQYIFGQTIVVILWIALNAVAIGYHWDPYPFILLNLAFSTQAAYAAPLILLAQTRQAERDKVSEARAEQAREHAEEMASKPGCGDQGRDRQARGAAQLEHGAHTAGQGADGARRGADARDPRPGDERVNRLPTC